MADTDYQLVANPQATIPMPDPEPLARLVMLRFRAAAMWRATDRVGGITVEDGIHLAHANFNSVLTGRDCQLAAESGVDLHLSMTRYKTNVLRGLLHEAIFSSDRITPYKVTATPIIELSPGARMKAIAQFKASLLADATIKQLNPTDRARRLKTRALQEEQKVANAAALRLADIFETDNQLNKLDSELRALTFYFSLYGGAGMVGPYAAGFSVQDFGSGRTVRKTVTVPTFRHFHPADYFCSSDAAQGGRGTYDIIRTRMTKYELASCMNLPGYNTENIKRLMLYFSQPAVTREWLSINPDDRQRHTPTGVWDTHETLVVLRHYGLVSGSELAQYGVSASLWDYFDTEIWSIGAWVVYMKITTNPDPQQRPVYFSSYLKEPGHVWGWGGGLILKDFERSFMSAIRGTFENFSYTVGPMGEVDVKRVAKYMDDKSLQRIHPGVVVKTDPDIAHGRNAYSFYDVPNHTQLGISMANWVLTLADQFTQLPAVFSGQAVGSGVNRTFRGVLNLETNALKGVMSGFANLDRDIFEPMGVAHFDYRMMNTKDTTGMGALLVQAKGLSGVLAEKLQKEQSQEQLRLVAQLAASGKVPDNVLTYVVNKALEIGGVPLDEIDAGTGGAQPPPPVTGGPTAPQPQGPPSALLSAPSGAR